MVVGLPRSQSLAGTPQLVSPAAVARAAGRKTPTGTPAPGRRRQVDLHFYGVTSEDVAEVLARVNREHDQGVS
jgi:hypothetical protein